MHLVLDTNVIFSALIAGGKTRELIITESLSLSVPEFFYSELENNRDEVAEKTGLGRRDLTVLLNLLFEHVNVVPREEFDHRLADARAEIEGTDPDDVPFLGLALHLGVDIWSDDEDFQQQSVVDVWRTHELVSKLDG